MVEYEKDYDGLSSYDNTTVFWTGMQNTGCKQTINYGAVPGCDGHWI